MKSLIVAIVAITAISHPADAGDLREAAVLAPVAAFYRAFDAGFTGPADFATADWNHINPGGGWTRDRDAVLAEVRSVHQGFLRNVTDRPLQTDVRFAGADTAVVTVTSVMSPYAPPRGTRVQAERHIRTFVVVRRANGWKVMQDQNTTISPPAAP
jgi:hypothetical protein